MDPLKPPLFDAYRDPFGFISGQKSPTQSSGNAVLFSAEERILRQRLGTWSEKDQADLIRRIWNHCEPVGGFLTRPEPYAQDQESLDDYIGYASICPVLARAALDYGWRHFYRPIWPLRFRYQYSLLRNDMARDCGEKDAPAWLGRFPALIAHFEWCAGELPPLWRRLWWAVSIATGGSDTNQDPWILNWILLDSPGARSWLGQLAWRIYWKRLRGSAYGSLAAVFARYFNDPEHPVAIAAESLGL